MANRMNPRVLRLTELSLLTAIIVVMAFTPLGYFRVTGLSITLLQIPVAMGAVLLGPSAGAFLGGVFGVTSVLQCFGLEPFGTAMFNISPLKWSFVCLASRILMGFLVGWIFKGVKKTGVIPLATGAAGFFAAALNTVFYLGLMVLLFANVDVTYAGVTTHITPSLAFIIAVISINGVIEAAVATAVGAAVIFPVYKVLNKRYVA